MWVVLLTAAAVSFFGTTSLMLLGAIGWLERLHVHEVLMPTRLFVVIPLVCGVAIALGLKHGRDSATWLRVTLALISSIVGSALAVFASVLIACELQPACF